MDAVIRKQLKIRACKARMGIIEGVFNAKSGHPGGSLSCVDILTLCYTAKVTGCDESKKEIYVFYVQEDHLLKSTHIF